MKKVFFTINIAIVVWMILLVQTITFAQQRIPGYLPPGTFPTQWWINGNGYTGLLVYTVNPSTMKLKGTLLGTPVEGYLVGRHIVLRRGASSKQVWEGWIMDRRLAAAIPSYKRQFFIAGTISQDGESIYPWYAIQMNSSLPGGPWSTGSQGGTGSGAGIATGGSGGQQNGSNTNTTSGQTGTTTHGGATGTMNGGTNTGNIHTGGGTTTNKNPSYPHNTGHSTGKNYQEPPSNALWLRHYLLSNRKGGKNVTILDIKHISNGGYIAVGTVHTKADKDRPRSMDAYLVRFNERGDILWQRIFWVVQDEKTLPNYNFNDQLNCVSPTTDGGFLIGGFVASWGKGTGRSNEIIKSGILIKTNADGNILWYRIFSSLGNGVNSINRIIRSRDGNYLLVGNDVHYIRNENEKIIGSVNAGLISKFKGNGQLIFSKKYYGHTNQAWSFNDIVQLRNRSIIVVGSAAGPSFEGNGGSGILAVGLTPDCKVIWAKKFDQDGYNDEWGGKLLFAHDGGVLIAGNSFGWVGGSYGYTSYVPYVLKMTMSGQVRWFKRFSPSWSNGAGVTGLKPAPHRGYYLSVSGGYLIKFDNAGNVVWSKPTDGGTNHIEFRGSQGLVYAGSAYQWSKGVYSIVGTCSLEGDTCQYHLNQKDLKVTSGDFMSKMHFNRVNPVTVSGTMSRRIEIGVQSGPADIVTNAVCRTSHKGVMRYQSEQIRLVPTKYSDNFVEGQTPAPGGGAEQRWELYYKGALKAIVVAFVGRDGKPTTGQIDTIKLGDYMPEEIYPMYSAYKHDNCYVLGVGKTPYGIINKPDKTIPVIQSSGKLYLWGSGFADKVRYYVSLVRPDGKIIVIDYNPDDHSSTIIKNMTLQYSTQSSPSQNNNNIEKATNTNETNSSAHDVYYEKTAHQNIDASQQKSNDTGNLQQEPIDESEPASEQQTEYNIPDLVFKLSPSNINKKAFKDSSRGIEGWIHGSLQKTSTNNGIGIHFNGTNNWIELNNSPALDFRGDMTIVVKAKINQFTKSGTPKMMVWRGDEQGGKDPYSLYIFGNRVIFRRDFPQTRRAQGDISNLDVSKSHVFCGVHRADKKLLEVWVDGLKMGIARSKEKIHYKTKNMSTLIGTINNGTSQFFDGTITDVQLYNRALTPEELVKLSR